jgi:EAL domain-containing protein (putative c-di-GMP-specific phosphodiesterase class I)
MLKIEFGPNAPPSGTHRMITSIRVLIIEDSPDDAEILVRELIRGGFDPEYERIESADAMSATLALGIKISIDDFGVGYSSLSYLRRLPVDRLKIDRSFVMNMTKNPSDAMIVRSTIDLAHNLGLEVVAEGVELEEQYAQLQSWGCDAAQGYFMSRPLPAEDLAKWLKTSVWGIGRRALSLRPSPPSWGREGH